MTYTGEVENGIIILNGAPQLEDGAPVRVEVKELTKDGLRHGSPEAIQRAVNDISGSWTAVEMDEVVEDLRKSKWEQIQREQENPEPGL